MCQYFLIIRLADIKIFGYQYFPQQLDFYAVHQLPGRGVQSPLPCDLLDSAVARPQELYHIICRIDLGIIDIQHS